MNEWTKCRFTTREPKRKSMKVPENFKSSDAFKKFKPKTDTRLFECAPPPVATIVKKAEPQ